MRQSPDVYTRIHAMLPHARAILATCGIDPRNPDIEDLYVAAAGFDLSLPPLSDARIRAVTRYVDSVFLLGIAVGLLLDRAALAAGGRPR